MKKKKIIPLLLAICVVSVFGLCLTPRVSAATYTTKAECASNVLTITATAPSAVTANTAFAITGVSSSSTAPNGITVNKIVSTSTASNASPSVVTGTWTGTGIGNFTATFPNTSLTAGGAVGSQVTMRLSSVDLYVNGLSNPITCSQANGQLTANGPDQSLTVFSIPITAAASAPAATTTPKTTSTSANKTTPTTQTPAATTTAPTTQTPVNTTADTQTNSSSQLVTITIVDSSGKPMGDVSVSVDGNTPVKTNARGVAIFENLSPGKHKVAVLGASSEITREIDVSGGSEPVELTVELPHQLISPMLITITGGVALVALLAGVVGFVIYRRRKAKTLARHVFPGVAQTSPSVAPVATVPTPLHPAPEPMAATPTQAAPPIQPTASVEPTTAATPSPNPVTQLPLATPAPISTIVPPIPEPVPPAVQPPAPAQPVEHVMPNVSHQPGQMIVPQVSQTSISHHS